MDKMWAGRFQKEVDQQVNDFNSSISFDSVMYRHDIAGSIAHAAMLGEAGIIEASEASAIVQELENILHDLESGVLAFDAQAEDVHMFVEEQLTNRLGATGKRLHTARSRNDQVALDLRLYLDDEINMLIDLVKSLTETICTLAFEHLETVMPGYTHLQRAQPVTFAHHIMAYAQMFLRDMGRLTDTRKRMRQMPLGSGALAGTTYPIDRDRVSHLLDFGTPTQNSLDAVSDRDFCIELAGAIATMMMHLSRFSEEIILWCSWEFRFIELDDAYATGSSIMPQKKNPDIAELVRGKSARAISNLNTLLTMMKGLPLAYNKDMQEDKEAIFDSLETAKLCLSTFTPMLETMHVCRENMRTAAANGFLNATDCADYLVKKGMPFRDSYRITGKLIAYCIKQHKTLEMLTLEEYHRHSDLFQQDVFEAIDLDACVKGRSVQGGPAPQEVMRQIEAMRMAVDQL